MGISKELFKRARSHETGANGYTINLTRAKELYEEASAEGNASAMNNLGYLLQHGGEGVTKDVGRAKQLYEAAAATSLPSAMNNLGYLLQHGGEGVTKDVARAKQLYEEAASQGNANAINKLGYLLQYGGEGVTKDIGRAKQLYEEAAAKGHSKAMNNLGYLLQHGGEGVIKDVARAKQLYEEAAAKGNEIAIISLGELLENGGEGVAKDVRRAKLLYEEAAAKENASAMYKLGSLLEFGREGVSKNLVRAMELFESASSLGHQGAELKLSHLSASTAKCRDISLEVSFGAVLAEPSLICEKFILQHVRAEYVHSIESVCAAHNLLLLSIRSGILTKDNMKNFGGTAWYFEDNLYSPASKLVVENTSLIDAVFRHAESIGIIKCGYTFKIAREIRSDLQETVQAVGVVFNRLFKRVLMIEQHVKEIKQHSSFMDDSLDKLSTAVYHLELNQVDLQKSIKRLSDGLTTLKDLIQKKDRRQMYAGVAKCFLSLIPVVGSGLANAAETGLNFAETIARAGVDKLAFVDLSNFQVASCLFSGEWVAKLPTHGRMAVESCVNNSDFQDITNLHSTLLSEIEAGRKDKTVASEIDVASSNWLVDHELVASASFAEKEAKDEKAKMYFQYITLDREDKCISIQEAAEGINTFLQNVGKEMEYDYLEDVFFDITGEDDDIDCVDESVFVQMYQRVRKKSELDGYISQMKSECSNHFRSRAVAGKTLSVRVAIRAVRTFLKGIEEQGHLKPEVLLSLDRESLIRTLNAQDMNNDEMIDEQEFIETIMSIVKDNIM